MSIFPAGEEEVVTAAASVEMQTATANTHSSCEIGEQLRSFIDPARVLTRLIDRIAFASDASLYRLVPSVVVQPIGTEEVRQLFRFSSEMRIPMVFRAGGTSLSGQAITDGILVDVGRYWRSVSVEDNGRLLRAQPGLIGQQANQILKKYAAKIGPDPASISTARLAGILSNKASGMCCGVAQNAYHTLRSMTFLLPSGTEIDTATPDADAKFRRCEPRLAQGLLELKKKLETNTKLSARVRAKYRMKMFLTEEIHCTRFRSSLVRSLNCSETSLCFKMSANGAGFATTALEGGSRRCKRARLLAWPED